jgi:25S rRNA (uracil2843-N3)-methyltransferase
MPRKRKNRVLVEEVDAPPEHPASGPAAPAPAPLLRAASSKRPKSVTAAACAAAPPVNIATAATTLPLAADSEQCALDLVAAVTAAQRISDTLGETLRRIKHAFSERDYAAVFSTAENLLVYMCAYVPSRALCYLNVLSKLLATRGASGTLGGSEDLRAWCLGAGPGSEAVAFGTWALLGSTGLEKMGAAPPHVHVHSFDVAQWGSALQLLHEGMLTQWGDGHTVSQPRSRSSDGGGKGLPLGEGGGCVSRGAQRFTSTWSQGDALSPSLPSVEWQRLETSTLLTAFFVLDEMWGAGPHATLAFLRQLRERARVGALFLAVDSAGSFSNLPLPDGYKPRTAAMSGAVGSGERAWMHAIVDDVLLHDAVQPKQLAATTKQKSAGSTASVWEALAVEGVSNPDSHFFRFRKGVKYDGPKLNNYRCWLRLYKRLS